jgi:eukaryotic-like serine/threonine-protein kinase
MLNVTGFAGARSVGRPIAQAVVGALSGWEFAFASRKRRVRHLSRRRKVVRNEGTPQQHDALVERIAEHDSMSQSAHPEPPFIAHKGDAPYLFVCYSHADAEMVYDELRWLRDAGVNVWYDEGIQPGHTWPRELANAIERCRLVLFFVSSHSLTSSNCRREVHFAVEHDKPLVAIHLDDSKLASDWEFAIGTRQALLKERLSEPMYREKLRGVLAEYLPASEPSTGERPPPGIAAAPSVANAEPPSPPSGSRWRRGAITALTLVVVAAAIGLWLQHRAEQSWLTQEAMPALQAFIDKDANGKAFLLAQEIERRIGPGTVTDATWGEVAATVTIDSSPAGADVSYRLYDDFEGDWVPLGRTPLNDIRLPHDWLVVRYQKDGFETALRATSSPGVYAPARSLTITGVTAGDVHRVELTPAGKVPAGMVWVPASNFPLHYPGFAMSAPLATPAFYVDRLETTNAQFQEFVDADGYGDARWWTDLEFNDGATALDRQAAVARFTDSTGKPAPAGWELGAFLPDTADQPVTGISWFEAMAYTRFRGKSLPSLQLWVRAAVTLVECCEPIGPKMAQFGNFGARLVDVGTTAAVGPYGTLDAGGNAAEWVLNSQGGLRLATGGSAGEAPYMFYYNDPVSPWDRSGSRGIRAVKLDSTLDPRLAADIPAPVDVPMATPLSAEAFDAVVATYAFVPAAAEPRIEAETKTSYGTLRRISLRSGIGEERFTAYILIPANATPPYQSVLAMSGVEGFVAKGRIEDWLDWTTENFFSPFLRSGRAVVWPVWYGSYERFDDLAYDASFDGAGWRERYRNWRRDAHAVISYLESSPDFSGRVGFLAVSFGAIMSPRLLYLVPDFKAAILVSGGNGSSSPETAAFVRHVTTPTLFLNGRFDYLVPSSMAQRYYDNIATPPDHKRRVAYDTGHWPLPRNQLTREIDEWLDRYLGDAKAP